VREMLANMSHGAKIAMLGIPTGEMAIDWNTVIFNMLTIKGIYGREMFESWYMMTVMLQSGLDITPVITHRFHYQEFHKAFEVMNTGQSAKVILNWTSPPVKSGEANRAAGPLERTMREVVLPGKTQLTKG
jgi:threonine 3-dehydrogenase